jgi:hypothetical protein
MNWKAILPGAAAVALSTAAFGQGDNFCATAQPIAGLGPWNFDNTAAGLDGPADCSGQPVRKDVWFVWTAPTSDGYAMSLCGGTTLRTRLAIYDGGTSTCGSLSLLGCGQENCGDQSRVAFNTIAGNQYLVRVGSRAFGEFGSGTFFAELDDCIDQTDDAFEENDDCSQAVPLGDGTYPALFVSKLDPDYYSFDVPAGGTLQLDWIFTHALGDIDIFMYDVPDCSSTIAQSTSGTDNEQIIWANPNACDVTVYVRTEHWFPDVAADCTTYDMVVAGTGTTGNPCGGGGVTVTCDPANNHTQGNYTKLDNSTLTAGALHVEATDGPAGEFGYLLVSAQASASLAVSNGILCLDTPQGRYSPAAGAGLNSIGNFNASGTFETPPNSGTSGWDVPATLPSPPGGSILSGQTWYFQLWYRDQQRSNFSNAIQVDF